MSRIMFSFQSGTGVAYLSNRSPPFFSKVFPRETDILIEACHGVSHWSQGWPIPAEMGHPNFSKMISCFGTILIDPEAYIG